MRTSAQIEKVVARSDFGRASAAKAGKVTITPAMLAAGVIVIAEEYGVCSERAAQELAADVFRAMIAAYEKDSG